MVTLGSLFCSARVSELDYGLTIISLIFLLIPLAVTVMITGVVAVTVPVLTVKLPVC